MKITIPEITIAIPTPTAILRSWKWGLLALVAVALTFAWSGQATQPAEAGGGMIVIYKIDQNTGELVGGAVFEIWDINNVELLMKVQDDDPQDMDPTPGIIRVFPPPLPPFIYHVVEQTPPPGYNFKLDPFWKEECDLNILPECEIWWPNDPKPSVLNVTFQAKPPLDPALMQGLCVWIRDGIDQAIKNKVCDGGPQDEDGATDAAITVTLDPNNPFLLQKGLYSPEAQTTKDPAGQFELDPNQVPGNGDPKRSCDFMVVTKCDITFSYSLQGSEVNITNVGQYALPKTCFEVRDDLQNPLFVVCDNDFQGPPAAHAVCIPDGVCEDEDATEGSIRVTVTPDDYTVVETKTPYNHTGDASKLSCAAAVGGKCDLTFVNTPGNNPWFPWDIDGNGLIDLFIDIFGVANHFGDTKP